LNTGITVIGKRAVIPRGVRIGRNVLIGEAVRATDFSSRLVRSGSTIERPRDRAMRPAARADVGKSPDGLKAASDGRSDASPHSVDGGGVGPGQSLRAAEAKD